MPQEYGRLDLSREIATSDGGLSREIVMTRPNARTMIDVFNDPRSSAQTAKLVAACCRAVNGRDEMASFESAQLDASDAAELMAMIASITDEADNISIGDGDGVSEPLTYDLRYPIELSRMDNASPEVIRQIQFVAKKLGDISEFLDAKGGAQEFYAFMRAFGTLLGTKLPMSESIIGAMDFLDYLVIKGKIMGKLTSARGRWKRTSTS